MRAAVPLLAEVDAWTSGTFDHLPPDVAIDLEADDALQQVAQAMAERLDDGARLPR